MKSTKRNLKQQKEWRKENPNYNGNWRKDNKVKVREKNKKASFNYRKNNPIKVKARKKTHILNEKTGICFDCKKQIKTEFHHLSYEPNIFIEVCNKCHNKRHRSK